jgi:hypothetical protein
VTSAGSRPRPSLHPHAVRVLRDEFGIDIAGQRRPPFGTLTGYRFDYVISLCDKARESAPTLRAIPGGVHGSIPAAAGDTGLAGYPAFQRTAVDNDTRIRYLLPVLTATPLMKEGQP